MPGVLGTCGRERGDRRQFPVHYVADALVGGITSAATDRVEQQTGRLEADGECVRAVVVGNGKERSSWWNVCSGRESEVANAASGGPRERGDHAGGGSRGVAMLTA